jgi:hypothetical protein
LSEPAPPWPLWLFWLFSPFWAGAVSDGDPSFWLI